MPLKKRGEKKNQNVNLKKTEETSYLLPLRARRTIIPQTSKGVEVKRANETGGEGGDIVLGSGTTGGTSVI